jgi:hypothetical protein
MMLKSMFSNLQEIEKPELKSEWQPYDKDEKTVNKAIKNYFSGHVLKDHNGKVCNLYGMNAIEDFFGLPYTSSSSYAAIWNTNTECYIDTDNQYNIEGFAITTDNKPVLIADKDEDTKYFWMK